MTPQARRQRALILGAVALWLGACIGIPAAAVAWTWPL